MRRRRSECIADTEVGSEGNGIKLIMRCVNYRAIGNLAQASLLSASNCSFKQRNFKIFGTSSKLQAPCNYIFLPMTLIQVAIGIVGDPYSKFIDTHERRVEEKVLCRKKPACKEINNANFEAARETEVIIRKERWHLKGPCWLLTKRVSETLIMNKRHSLHINTIQFFIRRLLTLGSITVKLVSFGIDPSKAHSGLALSRR